MQAISTAGWRVYGALALAGCGLLAAAAGGFAAGDSGELWRVALREQIMGAHKCAIEHFVSLREFELAGAKAIDGRLRCSDGREFDFARDKPHLKFEIRLCQPAVC